MKKVTLSLLFCMIFLSGLISSEIQLLSYDPMDTDEFYNSEVNSIELKGEGDEIEWNVDGFSRKGFKVVWSKNPDPVYPNRGGDRFHYYYMPEKRSDTIDAFDGPGYYHVRVCEYLGGKCGIYSNEIKVYLEEDSEKDDDNEEKEIDEIEIKDSWKTCQTNEDCVETQESCCSCKMGGEQTAINKIYLEKWNSIIKEKCDDIGCIAMIDCEKGKTKCIEGECEFVELDDEDEKEDKDDDKDKKDLEEQKEDCVKWFDGCNTCSMKNGKPYECTEIACEDYKEPRCLKYRDNEKDKKEEDDKDEDKQDKKEDCQGCMLDDKCYPLGYRKDNKYCSDSMNFTAQKNETSVCENNFECKSNVCVDSQCISGSLIQKIMNWFKGFFG